MPPVVPSIFSAAVSTVHTDGTTSSGGVPNSPLVNSSASVGTFTLAPLGITFAVAESQCKADDPPTGAPSVTASTTILGQVGAQAVSGNVGPNTTIPLGPFTVVLNEQVPGQSSDSHPSILVNAVHIYSGTPGSTYSNQGVILSESRCEVGVIPIPPGVVPESPLTATLPLSAIGVGGLALVAARSKRRRRLASR